MHCQSLHPQTSIEIRGGWQPVIASSPALCASFKIAAALQVPFSYISPILFTLQEERGPPQRRANRPCNQLRPLLLDPLIQNIVHMHTGFQKSVVMGPGWVEEARLAPDDTGVGSPQVKRSPCVSLSQVPPRRLRLFVVTFYLRNFMCSPAFLSLPPAWAGSHTAKNFPTSVRFYVMSFMFRDNVAIKAMIVTFKK
ncbi:hypothetical protein DdX_05821 [Ditylenchus destructor]|uniref:Uncharacterized protein n=1 Tax=Ditylenchus destructor TaxID=166010 RepID=A0AAD4N9L1_9BILA|nr:hypothetical protein DdX_05821 [Ditylenchus destructor]